MAQDALRGCEVLLHTCASRGPVFVNMADYSMDMLEAGCLFVDFAAVRRLVDDTAGKITGDFCTVTTPAGTNLRACIRGRRRRGGAAHRR